MDCAGGHLASGDVDGSYCNNGGCHGCEAVRGIEAGAEAASNEILEEMKKDPRRVEPSKVQVIKKSNHP